MIVVNARFLIQPITGVQRFAVEISLELKKILGDGVTFVAPNRIIQSHFTNKFDVVTIGTHQGYLWEQWDNCYKSDNIKRCENQRFVFAVSKKTMYLCQSLEPNHQGDEG